MEARRSLHLSKCHIVGNLNPRLNYYKTLIFGRVYSIGSNGGKNNILPIYRGSYLSAHVLLNLLNELGKRDKMRGLPSILSLFRNEFNKFNNTRARMLDCIYHVINTLKSYFWP